MPNLKIIGYKLTTNVFSYLLINTQYLVETTYNKKVTGKNYAGKTLVGIRGGGQMAFLCQPSACKV